MGIFDSLGGLVDDIADKASDMFDEGLGGLLGGDATNVLEDAWDAVSGDGGAGGLLQTVSGVFGGGDGDSDGGGFLQTVTGLLGGDDAGADDGEGGGLVGSITQALGGDGGGWSDKLTDVIDGCWGGDAGWGAGTLDDLTSFLPQELKDFGDVGSWTGSLIEGASTALDGALPGLSGALGGISGTLMSGGLGEQGFGATVSGLLTGALGTTDVAQPIAAWMGSDATSYMGGLQPDALLDGVMTMLPVDAETMADTSTAAADALGGAGAVDGAVDATADPAADQAAGQTDVGADLDAGQGDPAGDPTVDPLGDPTVDPGADPLGLDAADAAGSELDTPDLDPTGATDAGVDGAGTGELAVEPPPPAVEDSGIVPPAAMEVPDVQVVAEAPVVVEAPVDTSFDDTAFDDAIQSAESAETSVDDIFDGIG
jgi:hypothetical protein